jgi:thiaminase
MTFESPEELVSTQVIAYCSRALDRSRFFRILQEGTMSDSLMQYAFLQYRFFREQLHRWFGLCIVKVASTAEASQRDAVMALGGHVFTDLRDGHDVMFADFLCQLGLSDAAICASSPSPSTIAYSQSFFDVFGYGTHNFYEALATLSGRELCVALRNRRLLLHYFNTANKKQPTWLALHAELELDHFRDAVRPALARCGDDLAATALLTTAIEAGIDRHVQYFDEMLAEWNEHTTRS